MPSSYIIACVVRSFKVYSLSSFQRSLAGMLTIVTVPCGASVISEFSQCSFILWPEKIETALTELAEHTTAQ